MHLQMFSHYYFVTTLDEQYREPFFKDQDDSLGVPRFRKEE